MKTATRRTRLMPDSRGVNPVVSVVGAGLAGCEAAWQLVTRGIRVRLYEMRPGRMTPAHKTAGFAELVCSNSLKAEYLTGASGLLKAEMRALNSLVIEAAYKTRVPAGGALAVDREKFSEYISETLISHPLCELIRDVVLEVPDPPCVIATGPLTDKALAGAIAKMPGMAPLNFFDAAAPIVTRESLEMEKIFPASRYGRGGDDYLNCPMTEAEYNAFYDALVSAEPHEARGFEKGLLFEGCLPVEALAARGRQTLAYGPLKPVGLTDPRTGRRPFAAVQLRQENLRATLYNMVGFQTRLKRGEQKRVFSLIPGLGRAEFARYGAMHLNTYINSPDVLEANFALRGNPFIRFAGQMTGVEGYAESAGSGLLAGLALAAELRGRAPPVLTGRTMLGALMRHTITPAVDYQPMNANFGLLDPLDEIIKGRRARHERLAERALDEIRGILLYV